ncbi:MAG: NUDIX domain-containing protein [Fibrobacterota bacterium]|nr:NUDIX domain-containing protein [Fibrobacterota bacterium]
MNIVFDWAGTLADDQELTWRLTDQVIRSFGHGPIDFQTYKREFTLPAEGFYRVYCPGASWEQIDSRFSDLCRAQYPSSVNPWPGVQAGLSCLACKHRLFLMSTLDQAMLEETLNLLELRDCFEAVVGSVSDKVKALPDLIRAHGLVQDETVAIGDSNHDMTAAVAAGIEPIAVTYGYASAQALAEAGAEIAFGTFKDLLRHLDKLAFAESRHFPVATVGGLIRDAEGNLLLVRTRKWSGLYGIPGGKVDYGETMEAAFIREAREETGLAIGGLDFVMVQDCVEHPEFYRPRHFILVNYTATTPGTRPAVKLNHESDAYMWVVPEQALGMPLNAPTRILLDKILGAAPGKGSEV